MGTATQTQLDFPYLNLWGFPEKFHRSQGRNAGELTGVAGSPGTIEGVARVVLSEAEFDEVQPGDILVCEMTNPAWQVLFPKIAGLVTNAGGFAAHPAVLAREYEIPAVVGTSDATGRIRTGDRIRLTQRKVTGEDGRERTEGLVEVLESAAAARGRPARRPRPPSASTERPGRHGAPRPRSCGASCRDAVKDRLLEGIVNGTYPPGSRIVETRVARELGTSQAPVREALRDLEALGVVEISPLPRGAGPPARAATSCWRRTWSGRSSRRWPSSSRCPG